MSLDLTNVDWGAYLAANPDVAASGMDPATHWNLHGQNEQGRSLGFQTGVADLGQFYNSRDGTPIGPTNAQEMQAFQAGTFTPTGGATSAPAVNSPTSVSSNAPTPPPNFSGDWYLAQNQDVGANWGGTPFEHYLAHGQHEGRAVNPLHQQIQNGDFAFDNNNYLNTNNDVAQGIANGTVPNAAAHYSLFGVGEGREGFAPPSPTDNMGDFADSFSQYTDQFTSQLNGFQSQLQQMQDQWGQPQQNMWGWANPASPYGFGDPSATYAASQWNNPYNTSPTISAVYQPNQNMPRNGFASPWGMGNNPFASRTF